LFNTGAAPCAGVKGAGLLLSRRPDLQKQEAAGDALEVKVAWFNTVCLGSKPASLDDHMS
jgi:hypothetical protein